jgi:hypothetical protein
MGQYLTQQFGYAAPVLLVYLVGMILSIIFIRKYPLAAILALAATLILFANGIGIPVAQGYLLRARIESAWSPLQFSQMQAIVSVIGAALRTLGSALLIAAVFAGRKSKVTNEA